VRHSTTAAYYGFASIIIVVHVIRLHLDRHYVSSPETFDNAFSYKKVTNFLPENGPPAYLESLRKEQPFRLSFLTPKLRYVGV